MKTRQVNVKTNYRNKFSNLLCRLCEKPGEVESEIHLMSCEKILMESDIKEKLLFLRFLDQQKSKSLRSKSGKKFSRSGVLSWRLQDCPQVDARRTCQWDRETHVLILLVLIMIVLVMYMTLDDNIYIYRFKVSELD